MQFGLVGEIAQHWDAARVEAKAFEAAVRAGLSAERMYALVESERYFDKALSMPCSPILRPTRRSASTASICCCTPPRPHTWSATVPGPSP